jgi:UDP-N-acetylmuramoyl-tripeptide--D-alanyl-D-alanine ligase
MSEALWTAGEAAAATGGVAAGDWAATGVSIDTRTLELGELFVALTGDNSNGHAHVVDAIANGACAAVVSEPVEGVADDALLIVEDTLDALNALGRAARARTSAKVAAITGSVGKTSTKDALRTIFEAQGRTHASVASYNNHWGVPLTLARMPADTEWAIFEIGMNHPGEIVPLVKAVQPDVALVTTVESAHMAHFKSVEEIADAKGEIFQGLKRGGTAIVNFDNPHYARLKRLAEECGVERIVGFGEREGADIHLEKVALHGACSCVSATIDGQPMTYKLGVPGMHVVSNSLGILGVVAALGGDLALAGMSLASLSAPKGRGARHVVRAEDRQFLLVDESYNANPASMKAALATLASCDVASPARRVAVVGDMLELGADEEAAHRDLVTAIEASHVDSVFACGPLMASLYDALPAERRGGYALQSRDLLPMLTSKIRSGDVVMVKGSLGSRMGLVVDGLLALEKDAAASNALGN